MGLLLACNESQNMLIKELYIVANVHLNVLRSITKTDILCLTDHHWVTFNKITRL